MSTTTPNKSLTEPAVNDTGWGTTLNTNFTNIDNAFGGVATTISVAGNVNTSPQAFSSSTYINPIIKFSGQLAANQNYQLPSGVGGTWYIYNGTTNASGNSFTLTISSASNGGAGTPIVLQSGYWSAILCDTTTGNVVLQSTLPATAAGSSTQVQFNTSGSLNSSSAFTYVTSTTAFTATIASSANQLVVTAVSSGTIIIGMTLTGISGGTGITTSATILSQLSGTAGGAGTYFISQTNTGSTASVSGATLTTVNAPNFTGNLIGNLIGNITGNLTGVALIQPTTLSITTATTITPPGTTNQYDITALATAATIAAPATSPIAPVDGQKLIFRITDNGTSQSLNFTSSGAYRAVGTVLPITTVSGKTLYVGCLYNSAATIWDVVAVAEQ